MTRTDLTTRTAASNQKPSTSRRSPKAAALLGALVSLPLAASIAVAAPLDAVQMDPSVGAQTISYSSAGSPAMTSVPVVFTPPTRDAYTKDKPLELPCDVTFLSVGLSFKNVSAQPLYIEWSGAVFENGSEAMSIPDAFGRKIVHIADGRRFLPGEVGSGGFIHIAPSPLLSWTPESFPANVPLRLQLESRGFTDPTFDHGRGGYSLANQVAEDVIYNNNYRIWVQRSCP